MQHTAAHGPSVGTISRAAASSRRRVLLIAHTLLSLKYIERHHRLLAADPRLDFTITQVDDWFSAGVAEAIAELGVPVMPLAAARTRRWDMVIFATHGKSSWFNAASKVHVQHGIGAGKRVDGSDFTYGRAFALKDGRPRYDVMLEASEATRRRALRACPELARRIAVVGDLYCDDVLHTAARRPYYRASLGCGPDDTVLLLMSTWGPNGVMESCGRRLLGEAEALPSGHRVLVTMHNHLWAGRAGEANPWPAQMAALSSRFRVCQPMEDWVPYVVAADIAIVDHGSLGLYYALTGSPAITIAVPDSVVGPDAPATRLRGSYPVLSAETRLSAALINRTLGAWRGSPPGTCRMITSHPGEASERTRSVLYRELNLTPPIAHRQGSTLQSTLGRQGL